MEPEGSLPHSQEPATCPSRVQNYNVAKLEVYHVLITLLINVLHY
jgi:hypothetical protein